MIYSTKTYWVFNKENLDKIRVLAIIGYIMGKPKKELKKLHRKKVRKAKKKVQLFAKKELPFEKLTERAKHFLEKKRKQEKKTS